MVKNEIENLYFWLKCTDNILKVRWSSDYTIKQAQQNTKKRSKIVFCLQTEGFDENTSSLLLFNNKKELNCDKNNKTF